MGFRYRKSIRLGGGFRINISGSGVGYSWGVPGYRITKTANGKIRQTASIPGTGLSYSTEESIYKSARKSALKEEPYAQLTALFNYAQTFYGLQFNPCDAAGYMGSSVAGEMLIITKDQYEILRKEFRNEAYLLAFDILFWTGCREGEMLALLPKDLTDDDQLRIYKTYHRKKGQDILGPTKNSKKGGNRNVPIPHWLAEEFRTYCSKLYGLTPDDRVFYMTCTALNKELTRCTQLTYLPDIRVHDLRHSHVSLCIELGYSIVLVAKRIGDTVPVVMRTYAHLYPNKQRELVSRLETLSTSSSSKDESDLMPLV